jgi:hypothetical protein
LKLAEGEFIDISLERVDGPVEDGDPPLELRLLQDAEQVFLGLPRLGENDGLLPRSSTSSASSVGNSSVDVAFACVASSFRLEHSGLIVARRIGNQKHYEANAASRLFGELRNIVLKTVGLAEPLRDALKRVAADIRAAFVYGSVAKAADQAGSDIDLMVVSDTLATCSAHSTSCLARLAETSTRRSTAPRNSRNERRMRRRLLHAWSKDPRCG